MHFDTLVKKVALDFSHYVAYLNALPEKERHLDLNNSMSAQFVGHLMRIPPVNIYNHFFTKFPFTDFSIEDLKEINELHEEAAVMIPNSYVGMWDYARRVVSWTDFGFDSRGMILDPNFYTNFLKLASRIKRGCEATFFDDIFLSGFYEKAQREPYVNSMNEEYRNLTELMPQNIEVKYDLVDTYRRNRVKFHIFVRTADNAQVASCWDLRSTEPTLLDYL